MKKFVAVFLGSEAGMANWTMLDEKTRKEKENAGKAAWMNWANVHAKSVVDLGTPLGKTKQINPKGISDGKNGICAYAIVQAESHEAAAKLFVDHPHFSIFPGDSIEVMECLAIPGM